MEFLEVMKKAKEMCSDFSVCRIVLYIIPGRLLAN